MNLLLKIALGLIGISAIMFVLAASLFTYSGESLHPIISTRGMYSFMLWLPVFLFGGLLLIIVGIAKLATNS